MADKDFFDLINEPLTDLPAKRRVEQHFPALDIQPPPLPKVLEDFLKELGISAVELEQLQKSGKLDKIVGQASHYVSLLALSVLAQAIREGRLNEQSIVSLATRLPVVAQKLSGTDVQKHLIIDEERLKKILEGSSDEG